MTKTRLAIAAYRAWRAKRKANTTMGIFQSRTTKDVATAGGAAGIVLAVLTFVGEAWPSLKLTADVQAAITVLVTTVLIPLLSRVLAKFKGRQSAEQGLDAAVLDSLVLEAERVENEARVSRQGTRKERKADLTEEEALIALVRKVKPEVDRVLAERKAARKAATK